MYTLFVSLQVRPDKRDRFLTAIAENAAASVRDEPGCLRFDVMEDAQQPNRFYFYEIYTDPAAFDAHKAAPHFAVWRQAADGVRGTRQPSQHLLRHVRQPHASSGRLTPLPPASPSIKGPLSSTIVTVNPATGAELATLSGDDLEADRRRTGCRGGRAAGLGR